MAHMLTPRMNLGVGAIKDMRDAVTGVTFNAIYAIGGYSGKAILGTAEKYEIQTDTWTEIAPMKTPRRNVGKFLMSYQVCYTCVCTCTCIYSVYLNVKYPPTFEQSILEKHFYL